MGVGSYFNCCSCENIKKSVWFDRDENNENNSPNNNNNNILNNNNINNIINSNNNIINNNSINDNRRNEENIINPENIIRTNFNNGSRIVNANSFQPSELKLDLQPQQTDEFENMFNQLTDISGNNKI